MANRRTIAAIVVLTSVVLAGCSGFGGGDAGPPAAGDDDAAPRTQGLDVQQSAPEETQGESGGGDGGDGTDGGGGDGGFASGGEYDPTDLSAEDVSIQTALIRTGTVTLRVEDYGEARRQVADAAATRGGFVSDSQQALHRDGNRTWETGYVVVRVPAEQFSGMLDSARSVGEVLAESTQARDVSEQLVDLEARLTNLERKRARLREFYDRANTTDELLQIEARLAEVQGNIERLKASKRSLEQKVAYSKLRVELREPRPENETTTTTTTTTSTPYHSRSIAGAFAASVHTLVVLSRSAVVTVAYLLPYFVVAIPILGLGLAWRRRRSSSAGRRDADRSTPRDSGRGSQSSRPGSSPRDRSGVDTPDGRDADDSSPGSSGADDSSPGSSGADDSSPGSSDADDRR